MIVSDVVEDPFGGLRCMDESRFRDLKRGGRLAARVTRRRDDLIPVPPIQFIRNENIPNLALSGNQYASNAEEGEGGRYLSVQCPIVHFRRTVGLEAIPIHSTSRRKAMSGRAGVDNPGFFFTVCGFRDAEEEREERRGEDVVAHDVCSPLEVVAFGCLGSWGWNHDAGVTK